MTPASYNEDVVVERAAPAPVIPAGYTTASMDNGAGNSGNSWYEQGYDRLAPLTGLPPAGTIFTHQSAPNYQFRMAQSYSSNNAIVLDSNLRTGTLALVTPAPYTHLSLLESGGYNGIGFSYTIHHLDGTTESGSGNIPDWFNGQNPAWTANGRVDVGTFALNSVNGNNPRLYSLDITLLNITNPVTSIDFTYSSGTGHGAILALSGATATTFTPVAVTGFDEDIVVEAAAGTPGALTGFTSATMDTGTANAQTTWYEVGYNFTAPSTGLPDPSSIITNLSAPDHRYLLASSYTANNAILLSSNTPVASLTPLSPASYSALSFLTAAGNGPATIGCTIRHANGASENNSFIVQDWFTKSPVAFVANGRVNVSTKIIDALNSGNPRLYAADIPVLNSSSPITNIGLSFQSGGSANSVIFAVSGGSSPLDLAGDDFNANTASAATILQQWYNAGGLYDTTGWWNAANCLETVENVISANEDLQKLFILTNTFNLNSSGNFLNNYYDDEGWWANTWIRAYDLTGNAGFLSMAKTIFADMLTGWDSTCGGGLWWSKDRTYKNAIPNELFLLAAIRLHERTPGDSGGGSYFYWATNEWAWFKATGLINAQSLINDGLSSSCQNNGQTTWTYNQGVILGSLTDLYKTTGDVSYLNQATAIADAAIENLADANGVLREPCESGNCGGDGPQFKGIFIRYLAYLYDVTLNPAYSRFLLRNAHAVWFNDRNVFNQLGLKWDGPFDSGDAARQSSAMMAVSALAEPITADLPFAKGSGDPAFSHSVGGPEGVLGWKCTLLNAAKAGFAQSGPHIAYLTPGLHAAHFQLAVDATSGSPTNLVQLDVLDNNTGSVLASRGVAWNEFVWTNQAQDFVLTFTNSAGTGPLEFRVYWNNVTGAPGLTITDVTIDGLANWTAVNLSHDIGRLDGLNAWEADPVRDRTSGYLSRGPGIIGIAPGGYSAQFELKVDNFNWDSTVVGEISVVEVDSGSLEALKILTRTQFSSTRYQTFTLPFNALPGKRYDFRTYWYYRTTAPRLTQRSAKLRPGTDCFFTGAQAINGEVVLSFIGVPGQSYAVEATDDLSSPQWSVIGAAPIPASLGFAQFTDSLAATNRFYRLSSVLP